MYARIRMESLATCIRVFMAVSRSIPLHVLAAGTVSRLVSLSRKGAARSLANPAGPGPCALEDEKSNQKPAALLPPPVAGLAAGCAAGAAAGFWLPFGQRLGEPTTA